MLEELKAHAQEILRPHLMAYMKGITHAVIDISMLSSLNVRKKISESSKNLLFKDIKYPRQDSQKSHLFSKRKSCSANLFDRASYAIFALL